MGKTFRKNGSHNKFNVRDKDARRKFSKKFKKRPHQKDKPQDSVDEWDQFSEQQ